jgi:hypothetical protein
MASVNKPEVIARRRSILRQWIIAVVVLVLVGIVTKLFLTAGAVNDVNSGTVKSDTPYTARVGQRVLLNTVIHTIPPGGSVVLTAGSYSYAVEGIPVSLHSSVDCGQLITTVQNNGSTAVQTISPTIAVQQGHITTLTCLDSNGGP